MTASSESLENSGEPNARFRAIAGGMQSTGNTVGTALDALIEQLGGEDAIAGMVVEIRPIAPLAPLANKQPPPPRHL